MGIPQDVQQLQTVTVGDEEHETRAVQRQVHWIICQQPLQHALLSAMIPDPALTKESAQ